MDFSTLAYYLEKIEKTSSRNQMMAILAEIFAKSSSDEIDKICYLSLGSLAPKYQGLEFNLAEKLMLRVISRTLNMEEREVTKEYKERGDLGGVIYKLKIKNEKLKSEISNSKLSVEDVYGRLLQIAQEEGEGSVERKIEKMAELLRKVDVLSAKFIARMPVNKLRLGFSDMTVLDALSFMEKGDKSLRKELERAFNVLADIGKIAKIFKLKGIGGIKGIKSEVGVPIRAAKAERLPNKEKILEKMGGECAIEPKFDGFRVQIHINKSKKQKAKSKDKIKNLKLFGEPGIRADIFVQIFSRNLENTTHMFPDVVEAVQKLPARSAILDGEAIAYNPKTGKFLPFQETVQRKRKHGVGEKAKEMPLKVFIFDLLYLNGESLLTRSFKERRKLLEEVLNKIDRADRTNRTILLTEQRIVRRPEEFDKFFKQVVNEGLEGLMAKKLDAPYRAGARDFTWVKYKAGMKSELADTIDCVVMGYYRGKGKRSKFGIGAFLVGAVLPLGKKLKIKNEKLKTQIQNLKTKTDFILLTVSKIGTGLTDEQWRELYRRCGKLKVEKKPEEYFVDKNLYPDVWCRPELVVEIEADTITRSPIHTAGLALRFPRLKRFRDDKDVTQATSLSELKNFAKSK